MELAEETVAKALALGHPWIVSPCYHPVIGLRAAIPTAQPVVLGIANALLRHLIPDVKTTAGGAEVSAHAAFQAALSQQIPIVIGKAVRPVFLG